MKPIPKYGTIDPKELKVGDTIKFHDPVKGHHRGIVISLNPYLVIPNTTYSKGPILLTCNHTIEEIYS